VRQDKLLTKLQIKSYSDPYAKERPCYVHHLNLLAQHVNPFAELTPTINEDTQNSASEL